MRNVILGIAVAAVLAMVASDASIAGVEMWKVVLAGLGLVIFIKGGRSGGQAPS